MIQHAKFNRGGILARERLAERFGHRYRNHLTSSVRANIDRPDKDLLLPAHFRSPHYRRALDRPQTPEYITAAPRQDPYPTHPPKRNGDEKDIAPWSETNQSSCYYVQCS
jgi:hypothetical protein